ncbi:MAG TPA: peptidoglycan recognition family protein [Bryobacteraceae bacterium]|nr:peptidoglycan recognition family protein [Bryobacteraceae bacterium]
MKRVRELAFRLREPWIAWRAQQIADPVSRLRYLRQATSPTPFPRAPKVMITFAGMAAGAALLIPGHPGNLVREVAFHAPPASVLAGTTQPVPTDVWMIDSRDGQYEIYSNGLRLETAGAVSYQPRVWRQMMRPSLNSGELRHDPVGIVYHTTESHIAPFEPGQTDRLKRVGQWLITYLRRERSYHYLIDRFGRVHRIVKESDAAGHAGRSVWADSSSVYVNMNHEFLGVAFESATQTGDVPTQAVTPAQIRAARELTEMLRAKYRISSVNCVTHAQVSVNPLNHRIGNHTDWASNFPFLALGLPDNYELPIAAMEIFGFGYDQDFVTATGGRLWKGLLLTEERVRQAASAEGVSVAPYRAQLKEKYRKQLAELPASGESKEKQI